MIKSILSNMENLRYERKFVFERAHRRDLEIMLKRHPSIFKEIYRQRHVNNIYFDSNDFRHFAESVNGSADRLKVRIRWYEPLFGRIEKPILELKLKTNHTVGKLSYDLNAFDCDSQMSLNSVKDALARSFVPDLLKHYFMELKFSILNSYKRSYFLSDNKDIRITLDHDIQAFSLSPFRNSFLNRFMDRDNIILEMKYPPTVEPQIQCITNTFAERVRKSSKYVEGLVKAAAW